MLYQINLWKIHFVFFHSKPMKPILWKIRHLPSLEFNQQKRPSNWSHGREANITLPELACQNLLLQLTSKLLTRQFRKHLVLSHKHTETEPDIYDLWIKQINLQYNARSNKPCIQFHHKHLPSEKSIRVQILQRFRTVPSPSSSQWLKSLCVLSREQLLDVGSVCLTYS